MAIDVGVGVGFVGTWWDRGRKGRVFDYVMIDDN